ncbi:MAG: hypothetical protein IPG20_04220 [Gammaproteobacteria bacterium]|jgi:ribosome-associated translation inhibitor RaiA|nr:hypothetical protein [Gammaproteobacteria bacterium]
MNDLVIKLTGEVLSSNFEQWKDALVAQIRSTRTELSTDNDFVEAGRRVKLFKTAEATLQAAKESALRQAADIQRLFAAIDEVSKEARQARLALERQIRTRKQQIRDGLIETGIAAVRKMIAAQPEDFQLLDQRDYLDRARFELAVKGKMGTSGVYAAINGLCATIGREIEERSGEVCKNGQLIDSLPDNYRLLFQDRDSLVSLSGPELDLLIQQRIARLNEETGSTSVALEVDVLNAPEGFAHDPDVAENPGQTGSVELHKYRIVMEVYSSEDAAMAIARTIRQSFGSNPSVTAITLSRHAVS